MTRVLVTGARGFVGRWIAAGLAERGLEVHGATSSAAMPRDGSPSVAWHELDLLAPGSAARVLDAVKPELLVHAAWFTEHGAFWTSDLNYRWVSASLELLQAFAAAGGQRVVTVGSCAEYDWRHGFCSESVTPLEPGHVYGTCKVALFRMSERLAAAKGLSHAWARIFYPYGPAEHADRLVSSVIRALLAGEEARCTAGTQIRDVMHVADCGDAIAALAASPVEGAVNIGSGTPVALKDVIAAIGTAVGASEHIRLGALPMRPDDPPVLIPDVRRLHGEVGWQPSRSLAEGLADTIAWWRATGEGRANEPPARA